MIVRLSRNMIPIGAFFNVAVQLTIIAAIPFIYYEYPVMYVRLIAEDNWGEFTTFVALLIASFLFTALFVFNHTLSRNWWFLALAIGTFFLAMEEISWGQRLLGIPTPDLFYQYNAQGEITFHNLNQVWLLPLTHFTVLSFFIYGVLLPIISAVYPPFGGILKRLNLPLPTWSLIPLFVAPAYFWLITEVVRPGEIVELFVASALAALAIEQAISQSRLMDRISYGPWVEALAIPVCLLASFGSAVVISNFAGSSHFLHEYWNRMATSELPERGLFNQAEAIFSYLEKNPQSAPKDLLINKARFLERLDRREEAIDVLKQARDLEMIYRSTSPEDFGVERRLTLIYKHLGNEFLSRKHANEAFAILDRKIESTDLKKKKVRSSRPDWTYWIWSKERPPGNKKSRLVMKRGKLYEELGEYSKAINEYINTSNYAPNDKWIRVAVINNINRINSLCPEGIGEQKVTWQDIEQISKELTHNTKEPNWCSVFSKK